MLVELLAVGRGIYHLVVVTFCLQGADASVDGFTLHHHAGESPVGIVVHSAPLVESVVAQVVQVNFRKSLFLCPCEYGLVYKTLYHFGQY